MDAAAAPEAGLGPGRNRSAPRRCSSLAAITGMRSSELMELEVGCRRPLEEHGPGLLRYRLASKLVKGQPLGGVDDEWVVIEPAYQAAALAEHLHDNPAAGAPLLGRFALRCRAISGSATG